MEVERWIIISRIKGKTFYFKLDYCIYYHKHHNFSTSQGPPSSNDVSQKSESTQNTSGPQQIPKSTQNNSVSPANDTGNSNNPCWEVYKSMKIILKFLTWTIFIGIGNTIRGGRIGATAQRRGSSNAGNYNPNINVTGNDMQGIRWHYKE